MNVIIQNRRGAYANVIPQRLLPGEIVVVNEGDPASSSGQSVYIGTKTGEIQRLAFSNEVSSANIQAQEAAQQAQEAASNAGTINTQIQTKLNTVTQLAEQVATDAQTASTAAQTASDKADIAVDAQTDAETAAQTAVDVLDSMAPTYSPSATYNVGDLVIHDNQLYQCTTKISTAEAWNPNHWTESTVENELTNLKDDLSDKAVRFDIAQERTDAEKAQARKNIGANDNETIWDIQDRLEELENSLKKVEYLPVDFGYALIDLLKHVPYIDPNSKKYYNLLKLTM